MQKNIAQTRVHKRRSRVIVAKCYKMDKIFPNGVLGYVWEKIICFVTSHDKYTGGWNTGVANIFDWGRGGGEGGAQTTNHMQ